MQGIRRGKARLAKRLLATVTEREHALVNWYAEKVAGRPVADLLRTVPVNTLVARAEAAHASGASRVPASVGIPVTVSEPRSPAA